MEVPGGHENKFAVCLYEAIGTAMLLLAINWGQNPSDPNAQPTAIGVTLFIAIIIAGPISGAHFNPAVTIATFITNRKDELGINAGKAADGVFGCMIIFSQIIGGSFGCLIARSGLLYDGEFPPTGSIAKLCPGIADTIDCTPTGFELQVFVLEMIATMIFVTLI